MENKVKDASMKPVLQFSVLCDSIAKPEKPGDKPTLTGLFGKLLKPGRIPQFFIGNRWINGLGKHKQMITVLNPDLKEFIKTEEIEFNLSNRVNPHDIFLGFVNVDFPVSGVYWIKVELDGKTVLSYPFPVEQLG